MTGKELSGHGSADGVPSPWLDHYPEGIDWNTVLEGRSLGDMFDDAVRDHGDQVCTIFLGRETTYRQIGDLVNRLTAGLQQMGIGQDHRIGLFLPNTPAYVAAYYAVLKTGATVVNFNPLYTVEELSYQARDSDIHALVTLDLKLLFDKAWALAGEGAVERLIVCPFAPMLPPVKRNLFKMFKRSEIAALPADDRIIHWDKLLDATATAQPVNIEPESHLALLQYTGGTTGTPKGAMLTHANLTINVEQIHVWSQTAGLTRGRIMGILPFFHVFAMTAILNFAVRTGSAMILMPRFELDEAVKLIGKYKPTVLPGVPTLYTALLNHKGLSAEALNALKLCISGGAALPLEVRRQFEAKAGCSLVEGYGLSETSPVATVNPLEGIEVENSIGQPLPATTIAIRDPEAPEKLMPQGENGEICIKGPQVMSGYWQREAETSACMIDGYFRTGDIGYMDERGFTYLIDRIKDIIICSGFNVYPRRIEDAIYAFEGVAEVIVLGVPDEYRGEAPNAYVKMKPGHEADPEAIMDHLRQKISRIEMPAAIEFRDELPKTMVGKLSKKDLRDETSADA